MSVLRNCTFAQIEGTNTYICTACGFKTPPMRTPAPKIVRTCKPGSKPKSLPPLAAQAARILSAVEIWRAAGQPERTDDQVREIIETHCVNCEYFEAGRCKHAGCGCNVRAPEQESDSLLGRYVHRGLSNKLRMATEKCPLNKWGRTIPAGRPIRVAVAMPVFTVGGVERWIIDLATWFDPTRVKLVKVLVTEKKTLDPVGASWLPRDVVAVESPTITYDGSYDVLLTWGLLGLAKHVEAVACPVIDVQHGVHSNEEWQLELARQATRANATHGVHLAAVNELSRLNFPEEIRPKITVVPNGADPRRVERTGSRPLVLPENARIALYLGRISPEKNVQALVDAVAHLGEPWHAVIVGPERMKLNRLHDRVHLAGPQRHVGDWLAMADVLVHPSNFESHGLAINEAWLAGVPVVSCDYPVNHRFAELHGELMWLVPVNPRPRELATAIERADRRDIRVGRARAVALAEYTAEVMAGRWMDLIERVARP